jgi:hypothetical protein
MNSAIMSKIRSFFTRLKYIIKSLTIQSNELKTSNLLTRSMSDMTVTKNAWNSISAWKNRISAKEAYPGLIRIIRTGCCLPYAFISVSEIAELLRAFIQEPEKQPWTLFCRKPQLCRFQQPSHWRSGVFPVAEVWETILDVPKNNKLCLRPLPKHRGSTPKQAIFDPSNQLLASWLVSIRNTCWTKTNRERRLLSPNFMAVFSEFN